MYPMPLAYLASVDALETYLQSKHLSWEKCQLPDKEQCRSLFTLRIPLSYANLINWKDPEDPLRMMVMPSLLEKNIQNYELSDPIGDSSHEPVPGLIHRYPNRCLLLCTTYCGVHCRFCFRRDVIGKPRPIDIHAGEGYLRSHPEIAEVIFSGGDPLTFPIAFLRGMLSMLDSIASVRVIRFHTRLAVMDPSVLSTEWISALAILTGKRIVIVLHCNHAREISPQLRASVQRLQAVGIVVLSQSVLLQGVNDSTSALQELFWNLFIDGIIPYYLHHLDYAKGTHHFRISVSKGKALYASLRGRLPGYCIPEYVVDLPGGDGKFPVMQLQELRDGHYLAYSWDQREVEYVDQAVLTSDQQ